MDPSLTTTNQIPAIELSWLHRNRTKASEWYWQHPWKNSVMLLMIVLIVFSGATVFFIMTGMVQIPDEHTKELWLEVNFQILTVIFTIATLVDQPKRSVGIYYSAKFLWYRNQRSSSDDDKHRFNQMKISLDQILAYFPWFYHGQKPLVESRLAERDQNVSIDTFQNVPMKPFFLAMVMFNISTIAQFVVSFFMFVYHPPKDRPQIPIFVGVPVAIVSNFAGLGYCIYEQFKSRQSTPRNKVNAEEGGSISQPSQLTAEMSLTERGETDCL